MGAKRKLKTHCPSGHEFTPENTSYYRGHRKCRICCLIHSKTHNAKLKAERHARGLRLQKYRTHCPKGHEYTPENTRYFKNMRHCRECGKERGRQATAKQKAERHARGLKRKTRATHCPSGHAYAGSNVLWTTYDGYTYQQCRTCSKRRSRASWEREKARRHAETIGGGFSMAALIRRVRAEIAENRSQQKSG